MTGLARDWNILSELFSETLVDPIFPKEELDHARRIAEDSIRTVEDHSSQLCSKLFLESLFENHPYGRLTQGSLSSIAAIRPEKLKAFHRGWLRPDRLVISVSGAISRLALEEWVKNLDQRAQSVISSVAPFNLPQTLDDEPALKAPRWVERPLGREQTHILVGGLGTRVRSEDRYPLKLLQTLLGGQSGRLFLELREKKGLAYTVSPVSFEGVERGYVGTYIACAPTKREESLKGIRSVLEKLVEKGPSPQEMDRAKEFFLGRRAMDLQSDSALAAHYGMETLYQVPYLMEDDVAQRIKVITSKEIQQICRKYLVEPHMVTSVVG
jgi:zinc protease